MKQKRRSIKIYAIAAGKEGMGIYMDCSGKRVFLMGHRYDPRIYRLLKDGIRLDDLKRKQDIYKFNVKRRNGGVRRRSQVLENSMKHLVRVADEFIEYELMDDYEAA